MTDSFPPLTSFPDQVELLLSAFASVVEPHTAIYVSTPLTTGRRALEWHSANGTASPPDDSFRAKVIDRNRRDAANFVHRLRETEARVTIDPTALPDVPEWQQADYRYFWGRVIERYAARVVFRDGWQYSSGCAYEFLVAHRLGLDVRDEHENGLPQDRGRQMIEDAASEAESQGVSAAFLRCVAQALVQEEAGWR